MRICKHSKAVKWLAGKPKKSPLARGQQRAALSLTTKNTPDNHMEDDARTPTEVQLLLEGVAREQSNRRKAEIMKEMDVIHGRVVNALEHAGGVSTSLHCTQSEIMSANNATAPPEIQDPAQKRMKMEHQRQMLEMISNYVESLKSRKNIMDELQDWMESNNDITNLIETEDVFGQKIYECSQIHCEVLEALEYAQSVAANIYSVGQDILREAGFLDDADEEDETATAKLMNRLGKVILDDDEILADIDNFQSVATEVKNCLDHSLQSVRRIQDKQVIRFGVKQFKLFYKAMDRRMNEYTEKCESHVSLQKELDGLTISRDRIKMDAQKHEQKADALETKLHNMQNQLAKMRTTNASLLKELDSAESRLEEAQIASDMPATPAAISRVSVSSHSNKDAGSFSELEAKLAELERALATTKKQLTTAKEDSQKMAAKLEIYEASGSQKAAMDARIHEESKFKMKSLHNENEGLLKQVARLKCELNCKNELIDYQERRLQSMRDDLGLEGEDRAEGEGTKSDQELQMQRMVNRLKRDNNQEQNRLKAHIDKEHLRHEANLRKQEQGHKDQLLSVHRQSVKLLRSINRFKEEIAHILNRENLAVAANDVLLLPNLPTDENPNNVKIILGQLAGNVVELLVSLEFKLSQALMNKRLELKDNSISKNFVTKDLEAQTDATIKARQAAECLTEKLRESVGKLNNAESELAFVKKNEGAQYKGVVTRYRGLMSQYTSMQTDFIKMKKEHTQMLRRKERTIRCMTQNTSSMERLVTEQQLIINKMQQHMKMRNADRKQQLRLTVADQRHNLRLLQQALIENKISQEMYTMADEMIRQSEEIPALRLKHLFQRYIAYRRYLQIRGDMKQRIDEHVRDSTTNITAQAHVYVMDERLKQASLDWQKRIDCLETRRQGLDVEMDSLFSAVVTETGITLLKSHDDQVEESITTETCTKTEISTTSGYVSPNQQHGGSPSPLRLRLECLPPSGLLGTRLRLRDENAPMWTLPPLNTSSRPTTLNTPLILDLDVNQRLRAAQKALRRARMRPALRMSRADGWDYTKPEMTPLFDSTGDSAYSSCDTESMYTQSTCKDTKAS